MHSEDKNMYFILPRYFRKTYSTYYNNAGIVVANLKGVGLAPGSYSRTLKH
jgi:hypothetical protein